MRDVAPGDVAAGALALRAQHCSALCPYPQSKSLRDLPAIERPRSADREHHVDDGVQEQVDLRLLVPTALGPERDGAHLFARSSACRSGSSR